MNRLPTLLALALAVSGCKAATFDQRYEATLRECGVIGDGDYDFEFHGSDAGRCFYECLNAASCAELYAYVCESTGTLQDRCETQCLIDCGDGTTVNGSYTCDGALDCANGADEEGCADGLFACDDGTQIPWYDECDGVADCPDATDEAGCETFDCGDGTTVSVRDVCDTASDCANGADEAQGCATACPAP